MTFDELMEKSLPELREIAKTQGIPNIKKLRKTDLAAILAGDAEAPVAAKRGRKPGTKLTPKANASEETVAVSDAPAAEEKIAPVQMQETQAQAERVQTSAQKTEKKTGRKPSVKTQNSKEKAVKEQPVEEEPAKEKSAASKRRGRPPKAKFVADVVSEEISALAAETVAESTPVETESSAQTVEEDQDEEQVQEQPSAGEGEKREGGYVPRFVNRDINTRYNSRPRYNSGYAPRNQQKPSGYQTRRYENNDNGYTNNRRYDNNDNGYAANRRYDNSDNGYSNNRRYAYPANNAGQEERPARAPRQTVPTQEQMQGQSPEQETVEPYYNAEYGTSNPAVPRMLENEDCPRVAGILEVMPEGYGFLRVNNYYSGPRDIYLSITQIRRFSLRCGDFVEGRARPHRDGDKYDALMYIDRVNELPPDENARRIAFEDLVPIYPDERYTLEVSGQKNELSVRLIDLIAPIGKGQRAMIVSQPKAGKTTLLKQIAAGIANNYPEAHLMVLLIDERPEEVTDMKRCIQGEVIYSTFDELPEHHTRIAEMVQERAMRLVERGEDVVILLDSLTRLARAYNLVIPPTGRTLSGGMDPGALHKPKRFFGSARNIEGGGSLTIIATALVETGSRMDDIVYEEFKGTGNMEIHLDRKLSEKRIFPAIDIYKSGTRRDDLLLSQKELEGVYMLRKFMAGGATTDVTEQVIPMLQKTTNNDDFIAKIKDWIKIYENKGYSVSGTQNRYGQ